MEYMDINSQTLNNLTRRRFEMETFESTVHPFSDQGEKKVFKFFKQGIDIDNKEKKIIMLDERLKDIDFVVTAESIVRYHDRPIGYIMPYIDGKLFDSLSFKKDHKITILKDISEKLKTLHELGIVCADLIDNIIVDNNGHIHFIDHDNYSIDSLKIDVETLILREYLKKISKFDYKFDNYLFAKLLKTII